MTGVNGNRKGMKKGAAPRFIGAALVSLGLVNILLNARAASPLDPFYVAMAAAGAALIAFGSRKGQKD